MRGIVVGVLLATAGCTATHMLDIDGDVPDDTARYSRDSHVDAALSPPDANLPDVWPPPLPITVIVEDTSGAPAARQRVVFHDPTGAPLDEASTDALGMASSTRPGIAAITVEIDAPVLPWSGSDGAQLYLQPGLFSVWGVTPGETITFDMLVAERRVVTPSPPAGTSYVLLASPVGSTADPALPTLVWDGIGSTSILALAEPDTTTGALAYTMSIGDHTPGTITLPPWRNDYDGAPYTVTGAPAGLELDVGASMTTGLGELGVSVATSAPAGTLQVVRGLPPGAPIGIYAAASEPPYMGTPTWTSYEVFVAAGTGPVLLDVSRAPVIGPTALDSASLGVSWSTPVDAHIATLFLGFTDTTGNITNWTVLANGTARSVTVPQLPRDLAWHLPMRPGPAIQWNVALVRFDCAFDPRSVPSTPVGARRPLPGWGGDERGRSDRAVRAHALPIAHGRGPLSHCTPFARTTTTPISQLYS